MDFTMTHSNHVHHFIAGTEPAKSPLVLPHDPGCIEPNLLALAEKLGPGPFASKKPAFDDEPGLYLGTAIFGPII
jgi:hypothetical protein